MLARRNFSLENKPEKALCSITASTQYKLYINGNFISIGPARCASHHQSYDVFDIREFLDIGKNVIAVEIHHQRENVSYNYKSRGGLLCQIDFSENAEQSQISSNETWKVVPDPTWHNQSPRMSYAHMEVVDRRNLRQAVGDWKSAHFDDVLWSNARVLQRESGWPLPQENDEPGHLVPPWTALIPRDIPHLKYTEVLLHQFLQKGSLHDEQTDSELLNLPSIKEIEVDTHSSLSPFDLPAEISIPREDRASYILFDLNEVHNAHTCLDIEGSAGTVVDILSAPFLLDGKLITPLLGSHYLDRIVLSGNRDQWESQYWKPIRYLALIIRSPGEEKQEGITLHKMGVQKKEYPFEMKASFATPEFPELEKLYHASDKTIRTATTDAYTDNYRERRQYAQTAYYASMGNYHLFGDTALQRRYLIQVAEEQLANGLMPAYTPCHGDDYMVILDSNCFWLRGLYQYLIYSGDEATVLDLLPAACKLLDFFHTLSNDDSLIDSPPYPYWIDHAVLDRRGANLCVNAHYLAGLEDFINVLKLLGQRSSIGVDVLEERVVQIRQAVMRDFWNEEAGLFVDALTGGKQSTCFSEHAQAMVLALGIASNEQTDRLLAKLLLRDDGDFIQRESGLTMVTPAMSYFFHAGLCEAGEMDASLKMLWRRFKHMLEPGTNGTLWEEWWLDGSGRRGEFRYIQGRSDAQTESAFPPALFFRYVLGIEPVAAGMTEIILHYHASEILNERKGKMPTPQGQLAVEWQVSKEMYLINLSIPVNTVLSVNV
ncbi:MAG: alpha-L-rhamnosidase N-terminal domain-containing protein, partial [Candidatus Latescibacteria bacterium]|nr:alpha-L-rhamnosidase N-terminal domain-containing protein [Candidatus Latescibacterota bacterium]